MVCLKYYAMVVGAFNFATHMCMQQNDCLYAWLPKTTSSTLQQLDNNNNNNNNNKKNK